MRDRPRLTIVVAVEEGAANLPAILGSLDPAAHPDCDFVFCAVDPAELALVPTGLEQVRSMLCPAGARIPQMWRDGIVASRSELVALLTAHVVPAPRWLSAMLDRSLADGEAGLGGYFTNDDRACACDWAIYLLRYAAFSRPVSRPSVSHIAADNALYRKSEVLACADLVEEGFWEVEYHVRFLAKGLRLALSADIEVVHMNRYSARSFAAQRREHGFAFGRDRARRLPPGRLMIHALAAPLVPAILYAKVLVRAHRHGWIGSVPAATYFWLLYFVWHWAVGEARGLFREMFRRMSCMPWQGRRRPFP